MPKLNDTQTILLSAASQREDGSLYPLPDKFTDGGTRVTKAIAALVAATLVEERETIAAATVARTDGDLRYGLYVTQAGLAAIGVIEGDVAEADEDVPPARVTKIATVLAVWAARMVPHWRNWWQRPTGCPTRCAPR